MADALDLGSNGTPRAGSSPVPRTILFIYNAVRYLYAAFVIDSDFVFFLPL